MEISSEFFAGQKEKAKGIYDAQQSIYNPYFQTKVVLNSDGFHHLQFSSRVERSKQEQVRKFKCLAAGLEIIRKSGTVQEYRTLLTPIGKKSPHNGSVPMKLVEYWGMVAIVGENKLKIRVVLRRVGDGNITFWSVMPFSKIKQGKQKLFSEGIEDE